MAVSQLAFQQLNVPYHAYDAACALVRLGRHEEAVRWLVEAVEAGLDCAEPIRTDPALDPLRHRADFVQLASLVEAGRRTARGPLLN